MDSTEDKKEGAPVTAVPTNTVADGASLTHENTKPNAAGDSNPLSGAGVLLRSMRERSGMSAAVLAAGLKVSVRKIEALEDEHWQDLPDLVFTRALAASFCRYLRVDKAGTEKVLSSMPSVLLTSVDLGSVPESGVEMPSSEPGGFGRFPGKSLLIVLVILLLALVVYFLPSKNVFVDWGQQLSSVFQMQAADEPSTEAEADSDPVKANVAPTSGVDATTKDEQTIAAATSVDAIKAEDDALATSTPTSAPPAEPDVEQAALTSAASDQTQAASDTEEQGKTQDQDQALSEEALSDGDGVLRLTAKANSWIGIRELAADGKRKNRLLKAGESMSLPKGFVLPVGVTIGNAQVTQAEVRGKVLDLSTVSKGNVARFEIE